MTVMRKPSIVRMACLACVCYAFSAGVSSRQAPSGPSTGELVTTSDATGIIVVRNERLRDERISPFIYGNFIEFLDHHVQGMRAQMLDDHSFEGPLPPSDWCYYLRDRDVTDHPWVQTGFGGKGSFTVVEEEAYNGKRCGKIVVEEPGASPMGVLQEGIPLQAGREYELLVFLKQQGLSGPIEIALGKDWGPFFDAHARASLPEVGGTWAKYRAVLTPGVDAENAALAIRVGSPGTLWVDQVTLRPTDHIEGWRRDVVEAVKALAPRMIRFGGSAVNFYDWKVGIGEPDKRAPFPNQPWGRMEPNDVGIGEFLRFCELVGAEPLVCINANTDTPESAAALVEYCNGSADTEWGARRVADGRAEPYRVKYWQVGNELGGPEYEAKLPEFCRAMKQADPSIFLISAFPSPGVIAQTEEWLDFVAPHHYTPSLQAVRDDLLHLDEALAPVRAKKAVGVAVTEWNHTAGDWGPARAYLATQGNALHCARVLNLYQRFCHLVRIANRSNLTNSWCAGVIQTNDAGIYFTPAYHAMQMYSTLSGDYVLKVEDGSGQKLEGPEFGSDLDAYATISADGSRLTLAVVNDGAVPVNAQLRLEGFGRLDSQAAIFTLAADSPQAVNDFARPNAVCPTTRTANVESGTTLEFPPYSLTMIRWGQPPEPAEAEPQHQFDW
mgnify:CR=1 FL=1